jgi:hypothetical protein
MWPLVVYLSGIPVSGGTSMYIYRRFFDDSAYGKLDRTESVAMFSVLSLSWPLVLAVSIVSCVPFLVHRNTKSASDRAREMRRREENTINMEANLRYQAEQLGLPWVDVQTYTKNTKKQWGWEYDPQ